MTIRERENITLSFDKPADRGSVEETFFPWMLTVDKFKSEGLPVQLIDGMKTAEKNPDEQSNEFERFFNVFWGESILNYETHLGFDPVRRISFTLPFRCFEEIIIEDTPTFTLSQDVSGRYVKHYKVPGKADEHRPVVCTKEDWIRLKEYGNSILKKYYSSDNIIKAYKPLKEKHDKGEYSIRLNLEGFFWTSRELMGIEPHLFAFYDAPELIHDINEYILSIYLDKLVEMLDVLPADVIYIMEDLSGKDGPMLSPDFFDEFIGSYYKRLIPVVKAKGVKHVFVDTDGNFLKLIPNFLAAGVDGFLPMDVNAGMDIVKVRKEFPRLKFIGGFNKLCIADGKEAIDREFERIMPVIRQGGYIPGCDHQVAPSTSLRNYLYYINRLKESMKDSGKEL